VVCPEPERIAAVLAGTLPVDERGLLLDHAASCETCHAMLVALESESAGDAAAIATLNESSARGLPSVGERIDRYELVGVLGSGAMGVVFRARDPELGREVALKLLRPGAAAERLQREAQALARLTAPNVVRVYDVGEHAGRVFVVMELVEGATLRSWMATPRPWPVILDVLRRAGRGLAAAHRAGIVHRDFKPDNVLIAHGGEVLVGDFGLASEATEVGVSEPAAARTTAFELTATGTLLGTPAYMAPEQLEGEATAASDQYAFCITAWEACTGRRPIEATDLDDLFARIRDGKLAPPARPLPRHLERTLRRGLAVSPRARFASLEELLAALAPRRRRWPWVTAAAAGAAITVAVVVASGEPACALDDRELAWDPSSRATIAEHWGEDVAARLERHAGDWRRAGARACDEADHVAIACLARASARFRSTLAMLARGASEHAAMPELHDLQLARVLERCAATPIALALPYAAFDAELEQLEGELARGAWTTSHDQLARLRARGRAFDEPVRRLRLDWLDARVEIRGGDHDAAIGRLQRVIADADLLHEDTLRGRGGATLAWLLARHGRIVEARASLEHARASWRRDGNDPSLELELLAAEVEIATSELEHRRAAELQEQLVALMRARHHGRGFVFTAMSRLGPLWLAAGDPEREQRARAELLAIYEATFDAKAALPISDRVRATLMEDFTTPLLAGEHGRSIEIALRVLAALRNFPDAEPLIEPRVIAHIAQTYELWAQPGQAVVWRRNTRAYFERTKLGPLIDRGEVRELLALAFEGEARAMLRLGRPAEAIEPARRALELARTGDHELASATIPISTLLGRALVATGALSEARVVLEAVVSRMRDDASVMPYTRATAAFQLAIVLWETGDRSDRGRALALVTDADADYTAAREVIRTTPALRPGLARIDGEIATLARWRATHVER
jgi:predicted Ser/Thr protein kinase/tetratricopeptide (TPR) repeat protein